MKKFTVATVFVTVCLSPTVLAKKQPHYDYARVMKARPMYERVAQRVPVQHCETYNDHSSRLSNPSHKTLGPAIVGGVVGGTVGHAISSNHGHKHIGVIAGSIVGATIGVNINKGQQHQQHTRERHCSTTYRLQHKRVLVGYDVMYQYHGHRYHTHTKRHPGKLIRVPITGPKYNKHKGRSNSLVFKQKGNDRRTR